ncbi:MAG: group 1 glycosyl transferase, partial [Actinomycetota bacterium]
ADRLLRLAREPELRRRMGEAARERVRERFAIETQVRIFSEVYQALAAGQGLPAGTQPCELT